MREASESSVELAERGEVMPTLDELLARANREHELVEEALSSAVDHAIQAGEALLAARDQIDFKGWEAWVEENFAGGRVVASFYMRIAHYRELVTGLPNVSSAMRRLRGMPALRRPGYEGYSEEVREEARRLVANGMKWAEVARLLDVSPITVRNWCDPAALLRHRESTRQRSARKRAERRQVKEEQRQREAERAVKRVGGGVSEAYALIRRALQALDSVQLAESEADAAVREAITALHVAEDNVVIASRRGDAPRKPTRMRDRRRRPSDGPPRSEARSAAA